MGGAGWSLKGPQPRLQESLASSSLLCLTSPSPPPSVSACRLGLLAHPLQAFPVGSGESSGPVGATLNCAVPAPQGLGLGPNSDSQVLWPFSESC